MDAGAAPPETRSPAIKIASIPSVESGVNQSEPRYEYKEYGKWKKRFYGFYSWH
jgi:hypothetical protein